MYRDKKILAIVPARGGSKGLPDKNIKELNGRPLIAWTIEAALKSKHLDYVMVSTEDPRIAEISVRYGANIPFLRSSELAEDNSPISEVILDVLGKLELLNRKFDYVALLEPTSPLRRDDEIDSAIEMLIESRDDEALISVGLVHTEHPMIVKKITKDHIQPYITDVKSVYQRQQFDKAFYPYGVIYLSTVKSFKLNKTFYVEKAIPFFIERWQNYEIDDIYDFFCVESILTKRMKEKV
jgi:CMP-N,N'-diacetyllegionaminic acid synthase